VELSERRGEEWQSQGDRRYSSWGPRKDQQFLFGKRAEGGEETNIRLPV